MPSSDGYVKSTRSNDNNNCVEAKPLDGGQVSVRHSQDPDGIKLVLQPLTWSALLSLVQSSTFPTSTSWEPAGADLLTAIQARRTDSGGVELALSHTPNETLVFTAGEWFAFTEGARAHEFTWRTPGRQEAGMRS